MSAAEYTITSVQPTNTYVGKKDGKTRQVYRLGLEGVEKPAELAQLDTTPPPAVGAKLPLRLTPQEPPWDGVLRAVKDMPRQQFGGARPEDPKRSAAILRQHSQHMALIYFQVKGAVPETWGEFQTMCDRFDEDVRTTAFRVAGQ